MKMKKFQIAVLAAFVFMSMSIGNPVHAAEVAPQGNSAQAGAVTPQFIGSSSWVFNFSPNYIARNTYSYPTGTAHGATYLLADAYFKMVLNPNLYQPTISSVAGGLPQTSFTQQYDSGYGGNCWCYKSGAVWYNGNVDFKLKARTKSSNTGSFLGKWGSYNMLPNTTVPNTLYVTS